MNDTHPNLRQLLRTLIQDTKGLGKGDTEQFISSAIEDIQACRYCAFEKEQQTYATTLARGPWGEIV